MRLALALCIGLGLAQAAWAAESPATADYLRCEYRVDPLGIDVVQPRLSWEMHDARRGAAQTAYQVLVASTKEKLAANAADLWDSGKVVSDESTQIVYSGKPLASRTQCFWKVRLWDAEGQPAAYSKPALWSMGLLKPEDVAGKWIGIAGPMVHPEKGTTKSISLEGCKWVWYAEAGPSPRESAPEGTRFFRNSLTIPADRKVARARFMVAADDKFELYVNGKPAGAGNGHNAPQILEIANQLASGTNCLAIAATNGSKSPAGLIGKLVVEFDQGEPLVQRIDATWKSSPKLVADWNAPKFDDSAWKASLVLAALGEQPWGPIDVKGQDVQGCPMVRKEFSQEKAIRRATLYASALGNFVVYLNGQRVGRDYFSPGWTDYRKRVHYNTYDVTSLVQKGGNALGGVLAAGWYSGAIGWKSDRFHYGNEPRLFVQLEIEAEDGTLTQVASDGSWKTAWGPYIEGEFLAGETYDARKEMPGWDRSGFDDSAWKPVAVTPSIPAVLQSQPSVLVEETGLVKPVKVTEQRPGVFIFDLGQNFAGIPRLKTAGPAGTRVVLRHAEMLNPDGSIYTTNLRGARATDTYVLRGKGEEVYQPLFTFHGFRYVEVTGLPGKPAEDTLVGVALNSATPLVGAFECSSPMVNRLYSNTVWTQRANFISIPTDCPQRDERLGWTGDAEVFVRAATYNADVASFFTKWLVDLEDSQAADGAIPDIAPYVLGLGKGTAAWADAGTICPWTIGHVYGDKRLLEKHYGMMTRWVAYCRANSKGLLRPDAGYGDWLSTLPDKEQTPKDLIGTAFFAYSTKLTADVARTLGKQEDAKRYDDLSEAIKAAFNKAYVAEDGQIKGDTQTCYVMALYFDLLSKEKRELAEKNLLDDIQERKTHLTTGFIGTGILMPVLAESGNMPVAYKLLLNDTYPSWGYSIKHGATSIWERWDGWTAEKGFQDPGMNSFAHYSFGAVSRWMFQSVAGIDTDGPGYKRLLIRPQPAEGLDWVKASYRSIHGPIATQWKKQAEGLSLTVSIPANTVALVHVPAASPNHVSEGTGPASDAPGVKFLRAEPGAVVYEVRAGQYHFTVKP
jgi:alpha-L-rhamnosidase